MQQFIMHYLIICTLSLLLVIVKSDDSVETKCQFGRRSPDASRLLKLQGKRYSVEDPEEKYMYNVGICTEADQDPTAMGTVGVGAMQRKPTGESPKKLGKFIDADLRQGVDWMILEYYDGDLYTSSQHCNKSARSTMIMIVCSSGVEGVMTLLEESSDSTYNCFYMFELRTKYACPTNNKLSVGSIIVIVFLSLVCVYLLFGFLFQRFVKGAQGLEQIPNYTFWRDAGNLAADGCDLVFRSHSASDSREYRGMSGENTNQEIPRDSTDDQILTM